MVRHQGKENAREAHADARGPLVSVIIPNCRNDRTLPGAIHSIRTQTYTHHETIVIEDHDEAKGVAEARNEGIRQAKGEIIVLQDADDYSLPDRIEKTVRVFQRHGPDVVVTGIYVNAWNEQYQCMERHYKPPRRPDNELLEHQTVVGVCAFKRSLWEQWPFREETRYAFDWMMHLDFWLNGAEYWCIDEGLYEYVRYQGSASDHFERSGQRAEAFKIIRKILKDEYGKS